MLIMRQIAPTPKGKYMWSGYLSTHRVPANKDVGNLGPMTPTHVARDNEKWSRRGSILGWAVALYMDTFVYN